MSFASYDPHDNLVRQIFSSPFSYVKLLKSDNNINDQHASSTCYIPGSVLSTVYVLTHISLTTTHDLIITII